MSEPSAGYRIRRARPEDEAGVARLCQRSGQLGWDREALRKTASRVSLVATQDDTVIGVAKTHWHAEPDRAAPAGHYLGGIVIDPRWRRHGVGRALTAARLAWIAPRADVVYYFTNENNTASIKLHESFGFQLLFAAGSLHSVLADDGRSKLLLFALHRLANSVSPLTLDDKDRLNS